MQRLIDSYRMHNEDVTFSDVLSDENNRKIVELWLKNHPVAIAESPLLTDLSNRVTASGTILPVPFGQGTIDIEEKILGGKFYEVIEEFSKQPASLLKQIDLIKTHVELKTLTSNDVTNLLPLLLDHVSTKDIKTILKTADPLTSFPFLTNAQQLRLSAMPDIPGEEWEQLKQIFQKPEKDLDYDIEEIKNLEGLTGEEKNAAIAHYIERYEISLEDVQEQLDDQELLQLAPYLRYVDFRSFKNIPLAQGILKKCHRVNVLFVKDDKILEGIKELPFCQTLDCRDCPFLCALPALPLCQMLNCSFCPLLSALPALPLCQKLDCRSCPLLSALPALPFCKELNCSSCDVLSALPALPLCQMLACDSCPLLSSLLALPLCQKLFCFSCPLLSALPALPLCQDLYCRSCPKLSALPALPICQELDCSSCDVLSALPALPHCQKLFCYSCPLLNALPALPFCKELYCSSCPLSALPALPLCQKLDCSFCLLLSALPALPLCEKLVCGSCPLLSALPALPFCKELYCSSCDVLSALPALPLCQKLYCFSCPLLSALPALPLCQELTCYGCPLTVLPELTWNVRLVSVEEGFAGLPFTSLNIDIEKFANEPVSLLLQLGDHLLKNNPFPNIYYFEKGVRNEAIDVGGIRRDFVTKLCLNLFNEKGLKFEANLPIATSDNEEKAYRSLGSLLAQCYPANAVYKTGPLFAPELYTCMLQPEPGLDEWFLANYLTLVIPLVAVRQVTDLTHEVPALPGEDLTTLAYIAEQDASDISKYTQDYFSDPENRAKLRQDILTRAKQDTRLKAISWMAQEIRSKIPDLTGNLQEKIEGVLDSAALKHNLSWKLTNPTERRFIQTQQYLIHWIDHHLDQLEKFVYAVTGLRTLCAENLKIYVFDRDKNFIPVAHTCFFSLELSANYEDQPAFDKKIAYFLENALAGSSFTLV